MYTRCCQFISRRPTGGQPNHRSAHEVFSQFSHPFGYGAVRFLFWWLFLHLRLRPGNVGPTCVGPFSPPSAGPLQRVPLVLIRVAQESLATFSSKAFRLQLRASLEPTDRCQFSLTVRHRTDCRSLCWSRRP